jgi:hypothetical protein
MDRLLEPRDSGGLSLLVPEIEALQVKKKRDAERGPALDEVLSGEDIGRAGITPLSFAGGAHEPLDAVLGQEAISELGTDTHA